jgi:esterase/lipase superfamily enzyme
MFLVTNRAIDESAVGWARFGDRPNALGPHELRVAEIRIESGAPQAHLLADRLPFGRAMVPAGDVVARRLVARVRRSQRAVVLFVHGYNTTAEGAVARAGRLAQNFGVEPLVFTWPSNGGGMRGVASYRADKRDALASVGALGRLFERIAAALDAHAHAGCRVPVVLLAHSMGVYLLKHLLKSSVACTRMPLFDNVLLVGADTNAEGHAEWVDRIPFRRRLVVTINENDAALAASRAKGGSSQQARLGHWPYDLNARRATYVDLTRAGHVGASHAPFEGAPLRNPAVHDFFRRALSGQAVEGGSIL